MREIKDQKDIDKLILKNDITKYLKDKGIIFRMVQYENGEIIINMKEETEFMKFVMEGFIQIYGLRYDGSIYPVRYIDDFTVLGDVELIQETSAEFFVEAKSKVLCLLISISDNKDILLNDNYFLRFLIKHITRKLTLFSESQSVFTSLEEKLLNYMENECENKMITSVEKTSFQLRCSRRQLHRVLKKLLEEGRVKRISKGCYRVNNN